MHCRHGKPVGDCADCTALAEIAAICKDNGQAGMVIGNDGETTRFCKHGIGIDACTECGDLDDPFSSTADRDVMERCAHGKRWTEDCRKCDGIDGTSPEPETKNDPVWCSHERLAATCGLCKVDTAGKGKWYCDHDPSKAVLTLNGCALHAVRSGRPGDWKAAPPYHLLIDCLAHGEERLTLPPGFGHLQRYLRRDPWTLGIPWEDRQAPPLDYGFWPALLKKLPAGGVCIVTCIGAHGRTGTTLAALLLAASPGMSSHDAIGVIRAQHCDSAVETPEQREYLAGLALWLCPENKRGELAKKQAEAEDRLKPVKPALLPAGQSVLEQQMAGVKVDHKVAPCLKGESHYGMCLYDLPK